MGFNSGFKGLNLSICVYNFYFELFNLQLLMPNYEETILTFILYGLYILDTICKFGNMNVLYPPAHRMTTLELLFCIFRQ